MDGNNLIKKGIAVAVILLFIGLAFAPSINANISKASVDSELVEITTEVCGLNGGKHTVKITKEEAEEVEALFDSIQERLNATGTMDEAVEIFDEAVIELDRLGVLPGGMTIEKAQRLVTGLFKNNRIMKVFEEIYSRQKQPLDANENRLCLIAGTVTGGTMFFSLWNELFIMTMLIAALSFGLIVFELIFLFIPFMVATSMIDVFNPICMGRYIMFLFEPRGTVVTFGLNGLKVWKNNLTGLIPHWFLQYVGAVGFIGLKLQIPSDIHGSDILSLFLGFAPRVKIESS